MAEVSGDAGVRFSEAIAFLRAKLPEASVAWDDLAGPVHAHVFTTAGATTADLSKDLQDSLVRALENGTTLTQFRKDFDKAVQERGWTYNGTRGWRTALIFDVNMRSAHMAGRWAQLQANKDARPYLQYRTAGDARVRPQHRQWNGLIYPIDDAFWQTHYPPNGWNCRCTVRALSAGDLERRNLAVSPPFKTVMRDVTNRDGEVTDRVPAGIDPGWDHNVGQSWLSPEMALGAKLASLPRPLQGLVVNKTITPGYQTVLSERWKAFRTAVEEMGKPKGEAQVVGYLDSAVLDALASRVPELQLESITVGAFDNKTFHLAGAHKAASNPAQVWPTDWLDELPQALRNYRAVLWDSTSQALVVVPQGSFSDRVPRIVLRPNVKTRFGRALSVVSLGTAELSNLTESRFTLLVGRVR